MRDRKLGTRQNSLPHQFPNIVVCTHRTHKRGGGGKVVNGFKGDVCGWLIITMQDYQDFQDSPTSLTSFPLVPIEITIIIQKNNNNNNKKHTILSRSTVGCVKLSFLFFLKMVSFSTLKVETYQNVV